MAAAIEVKRNGEERVTIKFAEITDFSWDKMYIFGPYTQSERMIQQLGIFWSKANLIEVRDDINLIVFVKGNRVAQYVEFPRKYGDFTIADKNVFTPGEKVENVAIK